MIALVVPHGNDFLTLRRPLLNGLIQSGAEVLVAAPPGTWEDRINGCRKLPWQLGRGSLNPKAEGEAVFDLYRIYQEQRPTLVHHFTIKPNIYGTLAARIAGVPIVVNTVTGLGYFWVDNSPKSKLIRSYLTYLYRYALNLADGIIFQNADDKNLLKGNKRSVIIPGEGVEMDRFDMNRVPAEKISKIKRDLNISNENPVVLLVARMLWHKGVGEYVSAARIVRQRMKDVTFLLVGPADPENPAGVPLSKLQTWDEEGVVSYMGRRDDIRELMAISDLFVLPSYYREGIPRILVEAAAMSRPIITTDVIGCREVVEHGVNGILIPPKDPQTLAEAIMKVLRDSKQRGRFNKASRALAEGRYSSQKLVAQIFRLYKELFESKNLPIPKFINRYLDLERCEKRRR